MMIKNAVNWFDKKLYTYGMSKDLISVKEEIKCNNIMKR